MALLDGLHDETAKEYRRSPKRVLDRPTRRPEAVLDKETLAARDQQHAEATITDISSRIEGEKKREVFLERVAGVFNKERIKEKYLKEIVCENDPEKFRIYQEKVKAYQASSRLKRFFSRNPEVESVPREHAFVMTEILDAYIDTFTQNERPLRVLYPAAGGDTAGILRYTDRLKGRNIDFIFVDPEWSSTGIPRTTLIPRLAKTFQTEN
ncbi:MAG: hypothetical protein AAB431_00140, partial [Patescibacteria group bacterium]